VISRLRLKLIGWKYWGNEETRTLIDKRLIAIYCRIFSVHINKGTLKKWDKLTLEQVVIASKNIASMFFLPLTNEILDSLENKTKYKTMKNNILSQVPEKS